MIWRGTGISNPSPSSGESANFRSLSGRRYPSRAQLLAPRAPIAVRVLSESPALSAASVSASGSGSSARRRRCHTRSSSATGIPVPRDPHKASRRPGRNSRAATNRLAQTSHVRHVPPDQTAATDLTTKAVPSLSGVTSSRSAVNHLLKSVVRAICTLRSVGTGGGRPPPVTRWVPSNGHPYRNPGGAV